MEDHQNRVELIGTYGGDLEHALSAWTSTSRDLTEEKISRIPALLRMLAENGHESPFEKSAIHFLVTTDIATHIHLLKHRIGVSCLAGDQTVQFLNTNGESSSRLRVTLNELWRRWNSGRPHQNTDKDADFSKRRIQGMRLECLDEDAKETADTRIVRVIQNGVRTVWAYHLANGKTIRCTPDHLVLTRSGWKPISKCFCEGEAIAVKTHVRVVDHEPDQPAICDSTEAWRPVVGYEGRYDVSNIGRVRSYYENRYLRSEPRIKQQTRIQSGHMVVSLSGRRVFVHRLVLEAFVGPKGMGQQARHLNNNAADNRVENLAWGTDAENKADWLTDHGHPRNRISYVTVERAERQGEEMVYDLEVAGPYHNFTSGGVVVHNCNAESARYKELKDDKCYIPHDWPEYLQQEMRGFSAMCFGMYHETVRELTDWYTQQGMDPKKARSRAKESARFFLPYANQITADVQFNFRSFIHFLRLRLDDHAQLEIREIAYHMLRLVSDTGAFKHSLRAFGFALFLETSE
jgi:thymidylate synthase ThyX